MNSTTNQAAVAQQPVRKKKPARKVLKKRSVKDNRNHPLFRTYLNSDTAYKAMSRDDQIKGFNTWLDTQRAKHGSDEAMMEHWNASQSHKVTRSQGIINPNFKEPGAAGPGCIIASTIGAGLFFVFVGFVSREDAVAAFGGFLAILGLISGMVYLARKRAG